MKIVCLSFDDGTIYDQRFIELLNKHHLKATLNLNSGLKDFVWYFDGDRPIKRLDLSEYKNLYNGHEVASHSLTHPYFSGLNKEQSIKEVKDDIDNLTSIFNHNPKTGSESFISLFSSIIKSLSINDFLIIATFADDFNRYASITFDDEKPE